MSDLRITEMPEDKMYLLRTHFLNKVGVYASDDEVIQWAIDNGYHTEVQAQVGGSHYENMNIQPWEYFKANASIDEIRGACKQNVLKYMRVKKDTVQDLKKARWYLNEWIELEDSL